MVNLNDGDREVELIKDGLVMFSQAEMDKKHKVFDMIVKHFKIYHDEISLEFFTEILPQTRRIFEMEAGPNIGLMNEFIRNASTYDVHRPVFILDEEVGKLETSGNFVQGGKLALGFKKKLNIKFICTSKQDLFVNMVIPLANQAKGVGVIFQKVCENGVLPRFGFIGTIFNFIWTFLGLIFSLKFIILVLFVFGFFYFMNKERNVRLNLLICIILDN